MEKAACMGYSATINGSLHSYTLRLLRLPGKQIDPAAVHIPLTYTDFTSGITQLQSCIDRPQRMKVKNTLSSLPEPEIISRDDNQSLGLFTLAMASETYVNYMRHKMLSKFDVNKTNGALKIGLNLSNGALLLSLEKKQIQDKATSDDEFKKAYYALKNFQSGEDKIPKIIEKLRLETTSNTVMSPDDLSPQLTLFLLAYSSYFHIFDQV